MKSTNSKFCTLDQIMVTLRDLNDVVSFDETEQQTWQNFCHSVSELSERLSQLPTQKFAICAQDSYWFAVAFMACTQANKQIVLPGNYQPLALEELSVHFDGLLHDQAVAPIPNIVNVDLGGLSSSHSNFRFKALDLEHTSLTLFTSGSSGAPKAICKSLKEISIELEQLESQWGSQITGTRIHSTVSQQHIYGLLFRLLWPLCARRPFSRQNLEFPEQVTRIANDDCVLISSPALLKRMTEDDSSDNMRAVFSSGGPLSHDASHRAKELFGTLPYEVFGSTETGGIAFRQQLTPATPWTLFDCIEATLNQERCLRLKSPYIDDNHWYQTADECELINDRQFVLRGRTDRVIKIEEKRVSLVEVEKRLEQLDWVSECVTVPYEQYNRLILASVLVLSENGKIKLEQLGKGRFWLLLRKELREWLEPIAIPRRYRILEEIPLNSQGKRLMSVIEKQLTDD